MACLLEFSHIDKMASSLSDIAAAPIQPNGNITVYRVLQRQETGPDDTTITTPEVIFSGLAFQTSVSDLRPFTSYSFQVVAENGAGNVTSIPTRIATFQAPPSSFDAPVVTVTSATEISISWTPPGELNGEFAGYQVYQDGVPVLDERISELGVVLRGLLPFTEYEFFVEICGTGGCLNSSAVRNTTLEALPEMVSELLAANISSRSLVLMWEEPVSPNGVITEYVVTDVGASTVVFRGLGFSVSLSNLTPFTDHTYQLMSCNGEGCVASNVTRVRTLETDPEGLDMPETRNLTSTSVAVSWSAPARPNGAITSYVLRRGNDSFPNISRVIFQGVSTSFNDMDLVADTLYFYTVEAVNGGGSVLSARSFYRTVPDLAEGIRPPTLVVRGPTAIDVSWSAPESPNGEISAYRLYLDGVVVFTTDVQFFFPATGLEPFTTYTVFIEVCNQAGCASSISVSDRTQEALATGVAPPTLTVLGPTAVNVSWAPPTRPNGIITMYQIRRRVLNDPFSELIVHVGPASLLSFPNSGLTPFTSYEYRLRVSNGAGDVFSEWRAVQTTEDAPAGVSRPFFEADDIFARNVTATWLPPTLPNGIILRYVLEFRPASFQEGPVMTAREVPATVTTAVATGLLPVTSYEFRVRVVNSAGSGVGLFEVVTTGEDTPEGVQPIIVEQRTGSSLVLTWNPPLTPNGVVREYQVLLDGEVVYRDSTPSYTVPRLQAFTSYTLQLGACTSAGCSFGNVQSATTAEVVPLRQASPLLSVDTFGIVVVSWSAPVQPNGIITRYQVLRRLGSDPSPTSVVFTTEDVANRTFVDPNVVPAQSYQYAIRALNSAGMTDSSFVSISTPEAAPQGLTAPILLVSNASAIQVSWLPPAQPNGVVTAYQVFRSGGGATDERVFSDPSSRGFVDSGLSPFTAYTYVIQACTAAGCSLSPPSIATTSEATPTALSPPTLSALSEASISIEWREPSNPNGIITSYTLSILPVQINLVLNSPFGDLVRTVSNLLPFTNYTVRLEACNSVGCVSSSALVLTLESLPGFTTPPEVTAVNATALRVMWAEPVMPNGIIVQYEVRRGGVVVFSGDAMMFVEGGLAPNQPYSYTVRAFTAVGPGDESAPSAPVRTPPDTPEDVATPTLRATSSGSINATWVEPGRPNGVIQRYVLLLNEEIIFDGLGFSFEVMGLMPFTSYQFQLQVCTTTCGSSDLASVRTLEAPPEGQAPPTLSEGEGLVVSVMWRAPARPNGVITRYEVERRTVPSEFSSSSSSFEFVRVFSGFALAFTDADSALLRPAMTYEYRVTSFNSVGSTTSNISDTITLSEAPPTHIPPHILTNITSSTVSVVATPPATPNGVITEYRLLINGSRVQGQDILPPFPPTLTFNVTGLEFFTLYEFNIQVCTLAGCSNGTRIIERTGEAPPSGLSPPRGVARSQREIEISWSVPQRPNGVILKYV